MIKLVVSDMDGTLLDANSQLPPDFYEVVRELHLRGVRFCIASGRTWVTLQNNFLQNISDLDIICENGACTAQQGKITSESLLPRAVVQDMLARILPIMTPNMNIMLCCRSGAYLTDCSANPRLAELMGLSVIGQSTVPDITAVQEDAYKLALSDLDGPQNSLLPLLQTHYGDTLTCIQSGKYFVDVMNKGVSKGAALAQLQQRLGVTPQETMVFGDFYNDAEMMQCAEYSVLMENAPEGMRRYAKYSAPKNTQNGVMRTVREYILEGKSLALLPRIE